MDAMATREGARDRTSDLTCLGVLALLVVFFYGELIFTSDAPAYRDLLRTIYPLRWFVADQLRHREFPFWFPYEDMGEPLLGQFVAGIFHPLTALYLILPLVAAIKVEIVILMLCAAAGTYALARSLGLRPESALVSAVVYVFSGYVVSLSSNLAYLRGAGTLPILACLQLQILSSPRPHHWVALCAMCWASILLGGDPQTFAFGGVVAVVLLGTSGRWRRLPLIGIAGAAAVGLSCVELLPALIVREHSVRSSFPTTAEFFEIMSLNPILIPELMFGGWAPLTVLEDVLVIAREPWSTSITLGSTALAFALASFGGRRRSTVPWSVLVIVSFVLALGQHGLLLPALAKAVPVLMNFRYSEKYLLLCSLGVAVLCGRITESVAKGSRSAALEVIGLAMAAMSICVIFGSTSEWAGWAQRVAFHTTIDRGAARVVRDTWRSSGAIGLFGSLTAIVAGLGLLSGRAGAALTLLSIFFQMWWANGPAVFLVDPAVVSTPPVFCDALHAAGAGLGHERVRSAAVVYVGNPWRVPSTWTADTYNLLEPDACALCPVEEAFGSLNNLPGELRRMRFVTVNAGASRVAPLFDTPFDIDNAPDTPDSLIAHVSGRHLFKVPELRGRVYAANPRWVALPSEALARLMADPGAAAINPLLEGHGISDADTDDPGRVKIVEYTPNKVRLVSDLRHASAVILNDMYFPGWRASVDGRAATVVPANVVARAVYVAGGQHEIDFWYEPPLFRAGVWGSVATLALLVLGTAVAHRRATVPRAAT